MEILSLSVIQFTQLQLQRPSSFIGNTCNGNKCVSSPYIAFSVNITNIDPKKNSFTFSPYSAMVLYGNNGGNQFNSFPEFIVSVNGNAISPTYTSIVIP